MARTIKRDTEFELRSASDAEGGTGRRLEGYAAVFNSFTDIRSWEGTFQEQISKGAFKKTIREKTPVMQWDHGKDTRVGSTPIGSYDVLREDSEGLFVGGDLFDNPVVEPVRQAIEAGAVTGMSFAFQVIRDEWRDGKGKLVKPDELRELLYEAGDRAPLKRTIKELKMREAGPVLFPAYENTSVGVRTLEELTEEDRSAVIDEYKRTMIEERESDEDVALRSWLEAEDAYRSEVEEWLAAEAEHRDSNVDDETRKLQDDTAPSDAVPLAERKHIKWRAARTPEDEAVRKHTSHRDRRVIKSTEQNAPDDKDKPMTLAELRARLAEIEARQDTLATEFRDAALPEAEDKEWDALETEESTVRSQIEKIEKRAARAVKDVKEGKAPVETPSVHVLRGEDIYDLNEIRKSSFSSDDFADKVRDNAKRAIEGARLDHVRNDDEARTHIERLVARADGDDAELSKRLLVTGSALYERAYSKMLRSGMSTSVLDPDEARAIALGVDGAGGYNVPFQLDPTITLTSPKYVNPIREKARVVQITGKEWQTNFTNGATVYRGAEASTAVDGSPVYTQQAIRTNEVSGFLPYSYLSEASWPQVRSELTELLADAKDREEANAFLLGTGVGVQPSGLVSTQPAGNNVASTSGLGFTAADIYKLIESLPQRYLDRAEFFGNKSTFHKVRQLDTAGGGGFWTNLNGTTPASLIGFPINEVSLMASAGVAANRFLLLGDMSNFVIVDRIGMSIQEIPVLFDAANGNRPTSQKALYAVWMNNSKIINSDAFRILTQTA